MSSLSQFFGGGVPVGAIAQAPYNLTDPAWLPCDGRAVLRATYPRLSACLPSIGTFTATSRTKGAAPTSAAIANNGTLWCVTGPVGTNNIYTSTDGITFTPRTTPASCDIRSIVYDGTNFVAATNNSNGMLYSSNGTTWNTSASVVNAVGVTSLQTCMTWASTLGANGRFCMASAPIAGFFTSDDRGVTWTQRNSGVVGQPHHVCWTGTKFIATCVNANTLNTSTDGITWTAQLTPFLLAAASNINIPIISDGNGRVLIVSNVYSGGNYSSVYVSLDHGATWVNKTIVSPDQSYLLSASSTGLSYTNGRFVMFGASTLGQSVMAMSTDLQSWVFVPLLNTSNIGTISHKSGVYLCNVDNSTTAAVTLVEDTASMYLPLFRNPQGGATGVAPLSFIKVA